ncbi:UbiX family flavin prenyltransferase [Desulfopila aestuarii]|uniref:Flavin prenyltransferase UbiX n=1 Tax=Desulfopila aestuarii DSM 18488 TaxID=1121416 RepID=A0A1M7YDH2_9BACT|nr:UbiX family flavin prenyltransferase [Desulfopila aestuarii]SHO50653.1 4-hydroxy-3-polyprenylbenzoate decarboxylase [Desulfopila aestuarii DSM 18488]
MKRDRPKLLIAVTGATGMLFVRSFVEELQHLDLVVHGICSSSGRKVMQMELQANPEHLPLISKWFSEDDFTAAPASGSSNYFGMVVLPCTMGTLGAIAGGLSINLIHRAADVMLKERRKLVLAVRETPFNRTHLQNMLKVHDAGAVICPPMPGFYMNPTTLAEAAQTFSWRLADQLGLDIPDRKRWGGQVEC